MELRDLFTRGSHLADVPLNFRGMPLKEWLKLDMERQGEAYRKTARAKELFEAQKWPKRAVATFRDSYGLKGV